MRSLQSDVEQRGTRIFELVDKHPERLFSKAGFYQRLMALSMHDERFKTQLFRFVAVLPSLRRSSEIIQHLEEYFSDSNGGFHPLVGVGLRVARLVPWISAPILRWNVSEMARQFIAGRNADEVIATLRKRRAQKIGFTVDVLGEAVVSEDEADEYAALYGDLLEKLARETEDWTDPLGINAELFPVVNLSVKISALYSQMSPAAPADAIAHLGTKLRPLLRRARELGAFINVDMESYALKNTTLELFKTILTEAEFKDWPHAGIVIQAYLRDSEADLRDLIEWGRGRGTRFAVRLVKGAYWDYETTKSGQSGSNPPVFLQKPESDANFEKLTRVLFENESVVTPAFGSHNVRSIAHAQAVADELGIDRSRFEFQLLYGMAGPIKRALVEMGYRVREYCPIGELLPGMAYLVRRLLENTSNEGFLRAKFAENVPAKELLRDPKDLIKPAVAGIGLSAVASAKADDPSRLSGSNHKNGASLHATAGDSFRNAPLVSFIYKDSQDKMQSALREVRKRFGEKHPLYIGGEKIWSDNLTPSVNPAEPTEIVGYGTEAGVDEAERAVKAARAAFEKWRWTPFEERAQLLERAADILERRRYELSAVEVFEVGKPWSEADARHPRSDRLLQILRAANAATRTPKTHATGPRRRKLSSLLAAWRRLRNRAVEFSDRDSLWHGVGRSCYWKCRDHETVRAVDYLRCHAHAGVRRSRRSAGRVEFFVGARLSDRSAFGRSQGCRFNRVHRFARSRTENLGVGRNHPPWSTRTEAGDLRDGRQKRDDC